MKITNIITTEIEFQWEDGTKDYINIPDWMFYEIEDILNQYEQEMGG